MKILEKLGFGGSNGYEDMAEGLEKLKDDGDAVALFPYDDGTFFLKKAYFDKELLGGQGGYETEEEDKIALDGDGEAVRSLFGVDIVLAVDPTEHSAAVDPIKALVAHKNNIGEWIRVDKKGNVIEAGDAVEAVNGEVSSLEDSMVGELAEKEDMTLDAALAQLESQGDVSKVYDIAPPSTVEADDGELQLEEATHYAVDQSKAVDLLPTTTSTTELNVALDKARMEEHEEGKLTSYFIYGLIAGAIIVSIVVIVMFLLTSFL